MEPKIKITKEIRKIVARDHKIMMTSTKDGSYPFVAERGDGDYVYDIAGNKFIDFSTFIAVYNLGVNANKFVREAVKRQADKLMHAAFTDYYAELPVVFAEKLVKMLPKGFGRVFFSNSGTEANEAAIKISKLFTKRQYIMGFYGGFHGRTMGSLSLTSSKIVQREHYGPFTAAVHAPYAYCYRCPFGQEYPSCGMACVDYIKKYPLGKEVSPKEVAAIFIEPVLGEGGYVVPPKEFVQGVKEIASDNGILLVSDEVQSGYMRTGRFLGLDNFGVDADVYTMAKALGAGLPIGATMAKSSLGDIPEGAHSNTFGGNLVSIAAANASLDYLNRNMRRLKREAKRKGRIIMKRLCAMKEKYGVIGDVRGIGMMDAVELVRDRKTKAPALRERAQIMKHCFVNGLVLLPAGESTIRVVPPITISKEALENGLDIFESGFESLHLKER